MFQDLLLTIYCSEFGFLVLYFITSLLVGGCVTASFSSLCCFVMAVMLVLSTFQLCKLDAEAH